MNIDLRLFRILSLGALAVGILATSGCGETSPFPLGRVRGTVKYNDGSLIQADQIRIVFEPQEITAKGKVAPRAAEAYANVSDGTFGDLTTWKYGDGALVGHHKVTVMSQRLNKQGVGEPTEDVPSRYQRAATTPLEVDVISGGKNDFKLEIGKGT